MAKYKVIIVVHLDNCEINENHAINVFKDAIRNGIEDSDIVIPDEIQIDIERVD